MPAERQSPQLSPRELQLIKFASEGLTDTAIAQRLGISEATVGTYWGRVRIKIGPYNRTELVSIHLRAQQEEALELMRQENAQLISQLRNAVIQDPDENSFYYDLIDNAPDAMVLVFESGTVKTANRAAHELFGYDAGEMNGLALVALIPERFREVHQEHRAAYVNDPRRRTMGEHLQTPALRKDGKEIIVRAALSAIPTPNGLLVTSVLRAVEE
ncbi:PAS domain S-box protein [Fimbriimonas ginsengisoli]|nr:PAS domain S-box protein [Fimbriimonas ginsengisoli]